MEKAEAASCHKIGARRMMMLPWKPNLGNLLALLSSSLMFRWMVAPVRKKLKAEGVVKGER